MLEQFKTIATETAVVLSSAYVLSTTLAHLPFMPARAAAFFARIGAATSRFAVEKKVTS